MVDEGSLTLAGGAYAASANYAGYLLGALLAINTRPDDSFKLCLYSILGTALTIALLALYKNVWFLIVMRGLSGVFSATAMVGASSWLLQYKGNDRASPVLYAGIGFGILVSAELIAIGQHFGLDSAKLWFFLGGGGFAGRDALYFADENGIQQERPQAKSMQALTVQKDLTSGNWF